MRKQTKITELNEDDLDEVRGAGFAWIDAQRTKKITGQSGAANLSEPEVGWGAAPIGT